MIKQVTILVWKLFFCLLHPTWPNFREKIFSNDYFSWFKWKYCAVSKNVILMSVIYLHFSYWKFFIFCLMDWFRFQKPLAISPFRILRYQDFWDKILGWFLGFQYLCQGLLKVKYFIEEVESKTSWLVV